MVDADLNEPWFDCKVIVCTAQLTREYLHFGLMLRLLNSIADHDTASDADLFPFGPLASFGFHPITLIGGLLFLVFYGRSALVIHPVTCKQSISH